MIFSEKSELEKFIEPDDPLVGVKNRAIIAGATVGFLFLLWLIVRICAKKKCCKEEKKADGVPTKQGTDKNESQ